MVHRRPLHFGPVHEPDWKCLFRRPLDFLAQWFAEVRELEYPLKLSGLPLQVQHKFVG